MAAIVRYAPWSFLRDLEGEVNQLLDRNLRKPGFASNADTSLAGEWSPEVDIKEEADKFLITADLPGVDPKEIQVSMENNVLSIKGERKLERKVEENNFTRTERFSGTFYRRFTLPKEANGEQIQAKGKHGVLEISIPKKEPHTPKKIDVKVEEH